MTTLNRFTLETRHLYKIALFEYLNELAWFSNIKMYTYQQNTATDNDTDLQHLMWRALSLSGEQWSFTRATGANSPLSQDYLDCAVHFNSTVRFIYPGEMFLKCFSCEKSWDFHRTRHSGCSHLEMSLGTINLQHSRAGPYGDTGR